MKSEIVVVAGTGKERVEGRPRPGNEVRRTLMVWGVMLGPYTAGVRVVCEGGGTGWREVELEVKRER